MARLGFIGLGVMGRPMAKNLLKAGHRVAVHRAREDVVAAGGEDGKSPAGVAAAADIVFLMLPDSPQVRAVALGDGGLAGALAPGRLVVDMSSINPLATREIGAALAERGVRLLDAPVSGGQEKAEAGTLAIMAGGDERDFREAEPFLRAMGAPTLVGPLGSGQTAKLVNQTIVAVNIAAIAEGMALAKRAGVDPAKVFGAIRNGLAGSRCMEDKAPRMFEKRFDPGFRVSLHAKDLANVLEAGHGLRLAMPFASQAMEMLQVLMNDGFGDLDHSALAKYYEKLNAVDLGTADADD